MRKYKLQLRYVEYIFKKSFWNLFDYILFKILFQIAYCHEINVYWQSIKILFLQKDCTVAAIVKWQENITIQWNKVVIPSEREHERPERAKCINLAWI